MTPPSRPTIPAAVVFACLALGCGPADSDFALPTPGPGVVFSYPVDGQVDVPIAARIVVGFSASVDTVTLNVPCSADGLGAFCVVGPRGTVPGVVSVAGPDSTAVHFTGELEPGVAYEVFARPSLVPDAENLSASAPLFSFRTRDDRPKGGARPAVIAIGGVEPLRFTSGELDLPLVDFATLRVLLSEPVSPATVIYGQTVSLVRTDLGDALIPSTVFSQGIHLTVDPNDDLDPVGSYELRLTSGVRDLSGEPLEPATLAFTVADSRGGSELIRQTLRAVVPEGEPTASIYSGLIPNAIDVHKPIIGEEQLQLSPSEIEAWLANPKLFGGPIPFVIRRGQTLSSLGIEIEFSGVVPSGLQTGATKMQFISDATGVLYRNPYRSPEQLPADDTSPVFAQLTFDIALSADDGLGNAVLSQNILHVQTTGTATIENGSMLIETVGAHQVDILGIARGDANLSLLLGTDRARSPVAADDGAPALVASYPFDGQNDVGVTGSMSVLFDEPIDVSGDLSDRVTLQDASGNRVATSVTTAGGAVVVTPTSSLAYGTTYEFRVDGVRDLAGNAIATPVRIGFSTPVFAATDVPPALTAIYPGVPCALVGSSVKQPGRCAGGSLFDEDYSPFSIRPGEPIDAVFTQPMAAASLVLGTSCNTGAVRVEQVSDAGGCEAAVPGTLIVRERGFRFEPNLPWHSGVNYRLTLVAGGNDGCGANEICGANGHALNTDATASTDIGAGGGTNVVIHFQADTSGSAATYIPIELSPITDENGSGFVAASEVPRRENRAVLQVVGTSGLVQSAEFLGEDCDPGTATREACLYLSGSLPIVLGEGEQQCTVATGPSGPMVADNCAPMSLGPSVLFGTSADMVADTFLLSPRVTIGQTVIRIRESGGAQPRAYIYERNGETRLATDLDLYLDAPDLDISIIGSSHDLFSKQISVSLDGPLVFLPDGRVEISLSNIRPVDLEVGVDLLGIGVGGITLRIPVGGMTMTLLSPLSRGGQR